MRTTQRARRAGLAALAAIVIGGSGFAVGAGATASGATPAATATATPGPVAAGSTADMASYAGVVRQVLPSVVLIRTSEGLGSGVVLDRSGNIVTNAHVAGSATKFQVQVAGDTAPRSAHLVGTYPPDDLAVIRADDASGLQPAKFGNSDQAQAGDVVLAIGNPLGLSGSVTQGIVSATDRAVTEPAAEGSAAATLAGAIQTSAPINPGNSGGALVSASGQVIGIPTLAAASPQGGSQLRASASPSPPIWPAISPARSSIPVTSPTRTGPLWAPRSRPASARTGRPLALAWSRSPAAAQPTAPGCGPAT